ncbi:MAG: TM2 domain-containing protein [Bacteroidetes bacterium]|nr:TM2 domain-containing protein [Bacteroidota bacterium]
MANILQFMPELTGFELQYVQSITADYDEAKLLKFANIYRSRRKDPQLILLTTLLGFVVLAGVQRFILGQIGMGILYLFTGGLCLIGTIVDLVNYQDLAFQYNQRMANEVKMYMN